MVLNESSKLVAKARKLILECLQRGDIDNYDSLEEAEKLLEEALNKLTDKM